MAQGAGDQGRRRGGEERGAGSEIETRAREGADSVYRYVERTAERVSDGVRWQTLSYENEPQYDLSVFNGVAGIAMFLADYYRLTRIERALDLAAGALRWCSQPERLSEGSVEAWRRDGLGRGRAGPGMGWLRLAAVTGDRDHLRQACAVGDGLLRKDPGPVTDWLDGAAGEGLFLLRLAEATGDERFLAGAVRWAEWLAGVARRDEHGCYWPWETGDSEYANWFGLSFLPGLSGIGYFLLCLYQATRDERWAALGREAAETLQRQARPDHGGLNWPDTLDGLEHGEQLRCQWCNGAPGVGIFFVKAAEVLEPQGSSGGYLATAAAAGEATYQYGDVRHNAVQCHGLAGNGELLLDLYRLTGQARWRERAHELARQAFAYRVQTPEGEVWQADDPGYYSPDFMLGAAGTGHFFLRLWQPEVLTRPVL